MMRRSLIFAVLVASWLCGWAMPSQAASAPNCSKRERIVGILEGRFKERSWAYGLIAEQRLLEVFASERGTWTVLITTASGVSCVVASGEAWTEQKPSPDEETVDPATSRDG